MDGERSLWRSTVLCVVLVVGASACTGSGDAEPEVVSRAVESDSEPESPTTTETTTTTEGTSTTEVVSDDEAAVLEAVRRFFEELPDRPDKTKTPDQYPDVLDEYITDPLLTRIREGDAEDSAIGKTEESYPSLYFIDTVEVGTDEAKVTSCDLSRDATFDADGEILTSSASIFTLSDLFLTKEEDGVWRLGEWLIPPETGKNCDPVPLWGEFDAEGSPSDDPRFEDVGSSADIALLEQRFAEYVETVWFFDEREGLPSEAEDGYEAVASRHELSFQRDFLRAQEADPALDTVWAGWTYEIVSTRISGDTARMLMCAAPDLRFLSAADGSVDETDNRAIWSIAFMHSGEDGVWRVEYFWILGDKECVV